MGPDGPACYSFKRTLEYRPSARGRYDIFVSSEGTEPSDNAPKKVMEVNKEQTFVYDKAIGQYTPPDAN